MPHRSTTLSYETNGVFVQKSLHCVRLNCSLEPLECDSWLWCMVVSSNRAKSAAHRFRGSATRPTRRITAPAARHGGNFWQTAPCRVCFARTGRRVSMNCERSAGFVPSRSPGNITQQSETALPFVRESVLGVRAGYLPETERFDDSGNRTGRGPGS